MSATFYWGEDNGAAAGTPSMGTTRTFGVSQVNWKNTDDVATAYSSSPITAGNNSYIKYQFGIFSGSFNQISNGLFQHTTGVFGAGLTLVYTGTSGYATPATTALGGTPVDLTLTGLLSTGVAVKFGGHPGPQQAVATTLSATGYTHYLVTQLKTTVAASAGDTVTSTLSIRWDEN